MRTTKSIALIALFCLTFISGCAKQAPRPCSIKEDTNGRELALVMEKTGETLHLGVYHNKVPLEVVSILITDRRPYGITVKKDGDVIFDERFVIPEEEDISTPMELSLEQFEVGKAVDPALNPIIKAAENIPQLEYLPLFAEMLPVRVYWESMYSGKLEYENGNIANIYFSGEELSECTQKEQERQYELRAKNCEQSWEDYINSVSPTDADCLLCSLIAIDPCTGLPIEYHAIFGCIFGGPIGCGISIGIAIILWSSAAN